MDKHGETIFKHIEILHEYFQTQREYFEALQMEPEDEFQSNNMQVALLELEQETNKLTEQLSNSITELSRVALVLRQDKLENHQSKNTKGDD